MDPDLGGKADRLGAARKKVGVRSPEAAPDGAMSRGALRLLRDYAALSGGEVVAKVAGFAAFAYLSRILGPQAYGAVELAAALVMFASLIVDFGLGPIASAEVTRQREQAAALAARIPAVRLLLALLALGVVLAITPLLDPPPETRRLIWIFATSLLALPWTLNWLFQGLDQMAWVGLAQPIRMLCFAAGVVFLVTGPQALWKVGAVELGAATAMAAYFLLIQMRQSIAVRLRFDWRRFRQLLTSALPIATSQLLWALNHYLPTVLVAALVGGVEVAWFGSSLRIVISLNTFIWLYYFNLFPTFVRSAQQPFERFEALTARSFRVTAWLGVLCGLLGTVLAEPLCRLAYGAEFGAAGRAFSVLVWVLPVALLSGHARFALIAYRRQGSELASATVGSVTTLGLCLVLIPRQGAVGASIAMLAAALAVWVVAHRLALRHLGPLPFLGPLVRPAVAAAVAALLRLWLPVSSEWIAGLTVAISYVCLAPLLDRPLLRDAAALWEQWRTADR